MYRRKTVKNNSIQIRFLSIIIVGLNIVNTVCISARDEVCEFWGHAAIHGVPITDTDKITAYSKEGEYLAVHNKIYQGQYSIQILSESSELEGTPISFRINGYVATVTSDSTSNIWNEREIKQCNLEVNYFRPSCDLWISATEILKEGDTIKVYDPDTVLCGEAVVNSDGSFLVRVHGDDLYTENEDEGAEEGDTLEFFINSKVLLITGVSSCIDSLIVPGTKVIFEDSCLKKIEVAIDNSNVFKFQNENIPNNFIVIKNYPNPFNSNTVISYYINNPCKLSLRIFDCTGRLVKTFFENRFYFPGIYQIVWNGRDNRDKLTRSGLYLCSFQGDEIVKSLKMMMIY
jgi:hypothetical protein